MVPAEVLARRQVDELDLILRPGAAAARMASAQLRAQVGRGQLDTTVLRRTLLLPLSQAMLAGHLYGMRRAVMNMPARRDVKLGLFDSVLAFIKRRVTVDVDALQVKIKTQALRVLSDVSDAVEKKLRTTVDDLISSGTNRREAVRVLSDKFDELGVKSSSESRVETVFRTQVQLTYAAGKWEADQDPDVQEILWGYKYVTVGDDRVRPAHEALDGVTLPKDDPFWLRFWPPNGWNCRCQAIEIFEERKIKHPPAEDEDGDPVEPDKGFDFNAGEVFDTEEDPEDVDIEFGFNEDDHPRDEHGKFTAGGSAGFSAEKKLGGSTGATLGKNASGQLTVRKAGASKEHASSEHRANQLYDELGLDAPQSEIGHDGALYAQFVKGVSLKDAPDKQAAYDKLAEGFVADALLGNWDVVGLDEDNVIVDSKGDVYRIDNGGSLAFRAQGGDKGAAWGPSVTEITSMRDPKVNPQTAKVYAKLTDDDVKAQVKDVVARRDALLAKAGPDAKVLGQRIDDLEQRYLKGDKPKGWGSKDTATKVAEFSKHGVTKVQAEKLAKINDGTDDEKLFVPLALKPEQVAELQKAYPGKTIQKINANAYLPKGPATDAAGLSAKVASGETLKAVEKELSDKYEAISKLKGETWLTTSQPYSPAGEKWEESLATAEREAVNSWIGSSGAIRLAEKGELRNKKYGLNETKVKEIEAKVKAFNAALDKAPVVSGAMYRGIFLDKYNPETKDLRAMYETVGSEITFDASSSVSTKEKKAAGFTGGSGGILFKINGQARDIRQLNPGESEVVARRGSKYKVTGVNPDYNPPGFKTSVTLVEMEQINDVH